MSYFRWDFKVPILRISYERSLKIKKIILPTMNYQSTKLIFKNCQEIYPRIVYNNLSPYISIITNFSDLRL